MWFIFIILSWLSDFLQSRYISFIFIHLFHKFIPYSCSVYRVYIQVAVLICNPFPLPKSIPPGLTVQKPQFRFPTSFFTLPGCHPTPNLEGQYTVFITPGAGWSIHQVPILVTFYELLGLQWDCSFPPVATWGNSVIQIFQLFVTQSSLNGSGGTEIFQVSCSLEWLQLL
jgi:hypothetical protein